MDSYEKLYNDYRNETAKYEKKRIIQDNIELAINEQEKQEKRYLYKTKDRELIKKIQNDVIDEFNEFEELINLYNNKKENKKIFSRFNRIDIKLENYKIASLLQRKRINGKNISSTNPIKRKKYIKKVYKKEFYKLLQEELNSSNEKNIFIPENVLNQMWDEAQARYDKHRKNFLIGKIVALAMAAGIGGVSGYLGSLSEENSTRVSQEENLIQDNQSNNNTNEKNRLTYSGNLNNEKNDFTNWIKKDETLPGKEFKEQIVEEFNSINKTNINANDVFVYSGMNLHSWVNEDKNGVSFNTHNISDDKKGSAIEASYYFLADEKEKKIIAIFGTTDSNEIYRTGKYCSYYIDSLITKKSENESITLDGTKAIDLYDYAIKHTSNDNDAIKLLNNYSEYFSLIRQAKVEEENKNDLKKIDTQKAKNKNAEELDR